MPTVSGSRDQEMGSCSASYSYPPQYTYNPCNIVALLRLPLVWVFVTRFLWEYCWVFFSSMYIIEYVYVFVRQCEGYSSDTEWRQEAMIDTSIFTNKNNRKTNGTIIVAVTSTPGILPFYSSNCVIPRQVIKYRTIPRSYCRILFFIRVLFDITHTFHTLIIGIVVNAVINSC